MWSQMIRNLCTDKGVKSESEKFSLNRATDPVPQPFSTTDTGVFLLELFNYAYYFLYMLIQCSVVSLHTLVGTHLPRPFLLH
jgi:hypothetical protein